MPPPPPPPKLEGCREVVCRKCKQPRMVPIKPAPSPAQIAAKLAKEVRLAGETRRWREALVEDKAFMSRHSVGDEVAHSRPPSHADWLDCWQVVIYFAEEKLWGEKLYHGVVTEVEPAVVRKWARKDFVQQQLEVDYGDGSKEVRCCTQRTHTAHSVFAHTQCTLCIRHTQYAHTTHTERHTMHTPSTYIAYTPGGRLLAAGIGCSLLID